MRFFGPTANGDRGPSSKIARVPPWIFAFLLTGCPLSSFDLPGGSGGGTTTGSSTGTMMVTGCAPASKDCDDDNPCTLDNCEDGECVYEAAPEGTPCPDASTCNGAESCDGKGVCV